MAVLTIGHLASAGGVLFVDDDAAPAGDGQTWDSAYRFLQDALAFASEPANGITEIRVGQGTYKPDRDEANPDGAGDREATFQLIDNLTLAGGYAGIGAENPDARDIELYETILSGDLNRDDGQNFHNVDDNSYHVVFGSETDLSAVLDGCVVRGGNADDDWPDNSGAGLFTENGSPTVIRCRFRRNRCRNLGAAIHIRASHARVVDCTFYRNGVEELDNSLPRGGAVANVDAEPVFINCVFSGNHAIGFTSGGGGIFSSLSPVTVINCSFTGNTAGTGGGAVHTERNLLSIASSVFWNNSDDGGNVETQQIQGQNVVIDYSCVEGWTGAFGGLGNIGDDPLFADADGPDDLIGTLDDDLRLSAGSPCIDAGDSLAVNPCLLDPDGNARLADDPDTRDTGVGGPPTADMGSYEFGSPEGRGDCNTNALDDDCELAQDLALDCNENGQPDACDIRQGVSGDCDANDIPDECQSQADCNNNGALDICDLADGTSMDCNANAIPDECDIADGASQDDNGNGVPDECEPPIGDVDGDGDIDGVDLLLLLGNWDACGDCADCPYDLDDDCAVGTLDLIILLGNWG